MIPNAWLEKIKDKDAFLEVIDPDWRERFEDADMALDFYTSMDPKDFLQAIKESQ